MDERAKALRRCVKLLRTAHDERGPKPEREAALGRAQVLAERWGFTRAELIAEGRVIAEEEEPSLRRAQRAAVRAARERRSARRPANAATPMSNFGPAKVTTYQADGTTWVEIRL